MIPQTQCGVYRVLSLADVIKAVFPADITNAASRRARELSLSRGLLYSYYAV